MYIQSFLVPSEAAHSYCLNWVCCDNICHLVSLIIEVTEVYDKRDNYLHSEY